MRKMRKNAEKYVNSVKMRKNAYKRKMRKTLQASLDKCMGECRQVNDQYHQQDYMISRIMVPKKA